MTSLLEHAFVENRCNECGGSYRVTLYDALMEHQVQREWQPVRPCSACSGVTSALATVVPEARLEALNHAWQQVAQAAADAGLDLRLG